MTKQIKLKALYWEEHPCTEQSKTIECKSVIHEHFIDETEACIAFARAIREDRTYKCITGPGSIIRAIILPSGERFWLGCDEHLESIPLEHRPIAYAECQGLNDPCCGCCKFSTHGCNGRLQRPKCAT